MEPGALLWRHRSVTRIRWVAVVIASAAILFGIGRVSGRDDGGTTVRTERVAESALSRGPAAGGFPVDEGMGGEHVEPLLARTADDGTLLRVLRRSWTDGYVPAEGEWSPPPACRSTEGLDIGLVTDDFVTSGYAEVFGGPAPSAAEVLGSGTVGYGAIGEVSYAAVRSGDEGLLVSLEHGGTVVDSVEVHDGWAIVAAQVPSEGTEVVVGDERRPIGAIDSRWDDPECQPPPPALPDDVHAASADELAAIQAALDGVFARDADGDPTDPRRNLTDAARLSDEWLGDMRAAVASYTETGVEVEIAEAGVRDDGTGAAVYRLVGPPVGWNVAELAIVDGTWKVETQSWCDIVGLVFSCP